MASRSASAAVFGQSWMAALDAGDVLLPPSTTAVVHACFVRRGEAAAGSPDGVRTLGADDLVVTGTRHPLLLRVHPRSEVWVFRVPAAPFNEAASIRRELAAAFSTAASGMTTILGHVLRALSDEPTSARSSAGPTLAQQLAELVAAHWVETAEPSDDDIFSACDALVESALWDADLGPAYIAARMHISVRTLHRVFKARDTTVAAWIRRRRLEHCRADLVDDALGDLSIRAIGSRWGLHDPAHLSRLFKDAFGVTPTTFREQHASVAAAAAVTARALGAAPIPELQLA